MSATQTEKGYFTVAVPIEFRAKLERMATGSVRTLGSVVAKLISDADETASEWNIAGQAPEPSSSQAGGEEH